MIRSYGYVCEVHTVTTNDGYILNLHRIPGNDGSEQNDKDTVKRTKQKRKQTPVFLGHSVIGSSAIWAFAPNHSLAYSLADEGMNKFHFRI